MKILISILTGLLLITSTYSQDAELSGSIQSTINSLDSLQSTNNYEAISNKMIDLAHDYRDVSIDSSNRWFKRSLQLSMDHQLDQIVARGYEGLARNAARFNGNLDTARYYYELALPYNKALGDTLKLGDNYFNLARVLSDKSSFSSSLENYQHALDLYKTIPDSFAMGDTYSNISILYSKQFNFEQAIAYHLIANEIDEKMGNLDRLALNCNNIGLTYKKMGDYEQSMDYYRRGLAYEQEIDFPILKGALFNNIGNLKELQKEYDSSIYYQTNALKYFGNYQAGIGWAYKGLASTYEILGQYEKSIDNGVKSYRIGEQLSERDIMKQSSEVLAKSYAALGRYKEAYQYQKDFKMHSDSMFNAESVRKVTALEANYQHEQENRIKEIERIQQESLLKSQIREQKLIRNISIAGFTLLLIFAVITFRNYQAKKRVNLALEEKNQIITNQADNLKRLNDTKDKFFSIVSHDLRGPMGVFNGLSFVIKSLLKDKAYKELNEFADTVGNVAGQVSQLLDNLLSWAVQQQHEFPYKPESLNIRECVNENIEIFKPIADSKQIKLVSEITESTDVWADKNSLMTIIRNLINNALKFTPAEGTVTISLDEQDGIALVKVSDTGVGIPVEKLNTIFDFEEKEVSRGTVGEKGVGLGLQLVHDFVKLNRGKISVDSQVGSGTSFMFTLPKKEGLSLS